MPDIGLLIREIDVNISEICSVKPVPALNPHIQYLRFCYG